MWNPPPNVTEHNGEPLSPDRDFFVLPPAEIGPVRTAHTSLKKGVRERPAPVRAALALAAGAAGFLLMLGFEYIIFEYIIKVLFGASDIMRTPLLLGGIIFVPLWVWLGWRKSGFKHFCTFAGEYGCAHFQCERDRRRVTWQSCFRFQDASSVSTATTRRNRHGVYQGTIFHFDWYSSNSDQPIFSITGNHRADTETPPTANLYNFARAVESAWYRYATPRIDAEFIQKGWVKFYMGDNCWSVLGRGYIQFVDRHGKVSRCDAEEIGSAKLVAGRLTIRRKDAERGFFDLFNSEGVFGFPYGAIHNARLFIYLFERSLGIRVQ